MQLKKNIQNLKRIQTSLNRDLLKGINLDRNEKVDIFQDKLQNTIKKELTKNIFNSTPDIASLYKKLSDYLRINKDNIYIYRVYEFIPEKKFGKMYISKGDVEENFNLTPLQFKVSL